MFLESSLKSFKHHANALRDLKNAYNDFNNLYERFLLLCEIPGSIVRSNNFLRIVNRCEYYSANQFGPGHIIYDTDQVNLLTYRIDRLTANLRTEIIVMERRVKIDIGVPEHEFSIEP